MPTHYETLGLELGASQAQIRSAYRRLARKLHPDVNEAPDAHDRFLEVQSAYEVLSDLRRKEAYDAIINPGGVGKADVASKRASDARRRIKEQLEAEELRQRAEERMRDIPPAARVDPEQTQRLTLLLNTGKLADAERLALRMIAREGRQPVPYAVLGDIARFRGQFDKALQFYGLAAQFEPVEPIYQRKYEEMLSAQSKGSSKAPGRYVPEFSVVPIGVGSFLVIVMAVYTVLAPEKPIGLAFAPDWTVGAVAMLFLSGITAGSSLCSSGALDRFQVATGTALMRVSPTVALGIVSLVSFWVACTAYVVIGHTQQAFNRSLSVLLAAVGVVTVVFALAGWSKGVEPAVQNLAWGGNVAYFGALAGWRVTDALRLGFAQKGP